jgi:cell division topological specificity factor
MSALIVINLPICRNCKKSLLEVIRKYVNVDQDAISVNFEQDENQETLELNIVLPDYQQTSKDHQ